MDAFDVDAALVERLADDEAAALAGMRPGDAIGWLGLNHPRALALLRACERRGLRFVPLNWRLAAAELSVIVGNAGLQRLLHDDAMAALAAQIEVPQPSASEHEPGDLMIVYTSGTTGEPKGAIHTAAAMRANVDTAIEAQRLDAATRTLAVLPLFHVGGLCIQVLPTLAAGGVVRLHARFDADAWFDDVQAWRPTTTLLVPATMRALIEHPRWADADLSSLAFVNSGSQIVPRALIDAFHARGVPVCQVYGATETGPVTLVLRPDEALAHPGSVGRPARGVEVRLEGGEVQVRAPNLARGYLGRPDDPAFADGWFRSGDLARIDDQGFYEIVGRASERIISGGENVYPAEVENLLAGLPGLVECALVGLPDARWGEVPVLAVVGEVDETAIGLRLEGRVARYKQPRRVVHLDALPKTALGKVQRGRLVRRLIEGD
jgi:fatty-acyl-CoA synthase